MFNPSHLYFLAFPDKSKMMEPEHHSFRPQLSRKSEALNQLNKKRLLKQFQAPQSPPMDPRELEIRKSLKEVTDAINMVNQYLQVMPQRSASLTPSRKESNQSDSKTRQKDNLFDIDSTAIDDIKLSRMTTPQQPRRKSKNPLAFTFSENNQQCKDLRIKPG